MAPETRITIHGPNLMLRPLTPDEIDDEWREMLEADPMTIAVLPDEAAFKARLGRSGRLEDGWLDLAIDLDGECIGRTQTFVPPNRALPPGVFEVGLGPANVAMRTVFERVGWELVETYREFDREWVMYAITRAQWEARRRTWRSR